MTGGPEPTVVGGRRVVLALYVVTVTVAGVAGYLLGVVVADRLARPAYLGVVTLPATPLGLAVWGAGTVGTALAVALGLLVVVSRRYA